MTWNKEPYPKYLCKCREPKYREILIDSAGVENRCLECDKLVPLDKGTKVYFPWRSDEKSYKWGVQMA